MNQNLVKCDECNFEFSFEAVGIHEAIVELNNVPVTLVYFTCPKCNRIYRISIQDKRYYELKEDLEKTKKRIRKNNGSNNDGMESVLNSAVVKKHKRLKAHCEKIEKAFPGTFVFETSNQDKIIKYLP